MAKKTLIYLIIELLVIFFWLFFVGQVNGISALSGSINMIDEGQFAAWASHMLHGKTIYKDVLIQYGPLQLYPLYILMKFFGETMFFVRFITVTLGVFLGLCAALFTLKKLGVHPLLRGVTILFLLLIPGIHIRFMLGVLCVVFLIESFSGNAKKLAITSGVFLVIAFLFSTEVGIFSLIISGCYLLARILLGNSLKKDLQILRAYGVGVFFSTLLFAIYAGSQGWLLSYVQITSNVLTTLSGINLPNGQGLPIIFGEDLLLTPLGVLKMLFSKAMLFYWSLLLLLLFLPIVVMRGILLKATKNDTLVGLILLYSLMLYASIIGRSGHYFLIVPFVMLCASYFLTLAVKNRGKGGLFFSLFTSIFLLLFFLYGIRHLAIFRYTEFFLRPLPQFMDSSVPRIAPIAVAKVQAKALLPLQAFFKKNTTSKDTLFVINNVPALYFLLDRENATKYDLPLLASTAKMREDIVVSLKKNPPRYIIEDLDAWAVDDVSDKTRFPEVFLYLQKNYIKTKQIGSFVLYERNPRIIRSGI